MKSDEVFAVVVRTTGLIVCLGSGGVLCWALVNLAFGGPASVGGLVIMGGPPFLVGLWLLRGAPSLIRFAFRNAEYPPSPTQYSLRELFMVVTLLAIFLSVAIGLNG